MILGQETCNRKKGKTASPFLKKTYEILENSENYDSIRWASNGIGFVVVDQDKFAKYVLPKYFKHSNYSSFVRQLNMYNFHKIRQGNLESYFHHELFDRNDKSLVLQIKRKPQKKRRKNQQSQDEKDQFESFDKCKKNYKVNQRKKKEVSQDINDKKTNLQNTRDVFHSEQQNHDNQIYYNEKIFTIEQDDKLSINQQIMERCPYLQTRELINPSNNNIMVINCHVPLSNPSLIL